MLEYALGFMLMFAGHEMGHDLKARQLDTPISWHVVDTGLEWQLDSNPGDIDLSIIGGAGFRAQDTVSRLAGDSWLEKPVRMSSALNKLVSLFEPGGIHRDSPYAGDIRQIERITPNARYIVAATAIFDLYAAYSQPDWNIDYHQWDNGASGIKFSMRF